MITKYPWFGPKRGLGWGWTPVTWEGWLVTALCLAAMVAAYFIWGRSTTATIAILVAAVALVVAAYLTGTPPG